MKRTKTVSIYKAFCEQVRRNQNARAVVFEDKHLTYHELDLQACHVARHLQQLDLQPGTLVGLLVEPSLELIIGMLGIFKAGGAVVPLEPTYPPELLALMRVDTQMSILLTTSSAPDLIHSQTKVLFLDQLADDIPEAESPFISSHDLACCLFTSGSTGKPKGVLIDHQALINHCLSLQQTYNLTPTDCFLQFAQPTHIAGLEQILVTLLTGTTLVLRGPIPWTATEFPDRIKEHGITVIDLPVGYCQILLKSWHKKEATIQATPLRLIVVGGEVIPPEIISLWGQLHLPEVRLLNVYGMTEVSGTATVFEFSKKISGRVPIGHPLAGRTAYILDDQLQPVPVGVTGELYIGGQSLARGYLNRPDATEAAFIPDPFNQEEGSRLYKTGDLAAFLPEGKIDYLGRLDHQVQVRGFRVELEEIEAVLKQHPAVKETAVIVHPGATAERLLAYVVPVSGKLTSTVSNFWQADPLFADEPGVLTDPAERMAFKLEQHNIKPPSVPCIQLQQPINDDSFRTQYLDRQSYRQFSDALISFKEISRFLSCLLQLELTGIPIPKYRYPSAQGLYPVQTYLSIKENRIEGIKAGFYYYNPAVHNLQLVQTSDNVPFLEYKAFDQQTFEQSAFGLFLIVQFDAITPIYGRKLAREFSQLEAGHLGQLLMTEAPNYHLGLCPIAHIENFEEIKNSLKLDNEQALLYSFLGGKIDAAQKKEWMQPSSSLQPPTQFKNELRSHLTQKLPSYKIPDTFSMLETMPMTPNGKSDRQALPIPNENESASNSNYISPRTPTETTMANMWSKVLKIKHIGVENDFFELGGNSLSAIQLLTQIQQTFQVDLPLQTLLQQNTIAGLALRIEVLQKVQEKYSDEKNSDSEEGMI